MDLRQLTLDQTDLPQLAKASSNPRQQGAAAPGGEGDAGEESGLFSEAELRKSCCARLHTWNCDPREMIRALELETPTKRRLA
jgi:hypothetical protein